MTLTFNPKNHRYALDGKPVPGVTTLLKGFPKTLEYWSARTVAEWVADNPDRIDQLYTDGRNAMVGFLKEVPWDFRDRAAVRGTDVHALAERLIHGDEVEVPDHLTGHVDGYVRWLDLWQPKVLLTERPVGNRKWWYAGTFDLIADIDGVTWALDIKTSKGVYGEVASQIAAYSNAEFYLDENDEEQPLPTVQRMAALHVREDGTDFLPVKDPEAAWKDFLHAAWIYRAKDRLKEQIGAPLLHPTET